MTAFIWAQIISAITLIATIIGLLCKTKTPSMWWLFLANCTMLSTYLLLGRFLGALLLLGAVARSVVYLRYSQKNKNPALFVLLIFESYFVVMTILLWTDVVDLLMLVNLMVLTYATWQTNMQVLRVGYLTSSVLLFFYDIIVGAYVGILSKLFLFSFSIVSMVKNKKQKNK